MSIALRPKATMSDDELARWLDGRDDWPDGQWQDHCGAPGCAECKGEIPAGDSRAAAVRRRWEGVGA